MASFRKPLKWLLALIGLKAFINFYQVENPGPSPVRKHPELGRKHRMTRKSMIRATQNMIKCKKIVKKWLFDGFGHVGKMAIFEGKIQIMLVL